MPTRLTGTRVPFPAPGSVLPSQNSAAAKDVSFTGAVRVSVAAPFVGLGVATTAPSTGAVLSTTRSTPNSAPQLPAASCPRTNTWWVPLDSALTCEMGMSP